MKRKIMIAAGIAACLAFNTYAATRPQKVLGVEYHIETAEASSVTVDDIQAEYLAKALWGEARGVESTTEKAAVCWAVLNRVSCSEFPNTIHEVLTQRNQFGGYSDGNPVEPELEVIAADVLKRWYDEKNGQANVGRVIPQDYYYFCGDGRVNYFTKTLNGGIWRWELESPYED